MSSENVIGAITAKVQADLSDYKKGMATIAPTAEKETKKVADAFGKMDNNVGKSATKHKKQMNAIDKSTKEASEDVKKATKLVAKSFNDMANKVGQSVSSFEQKLEKMDKKMEETKKKAASKRVEIAADIVQGIGTTATGLGALSLKLASDAQESEALFEVSFKDMASSAREWSVGLRKELGLNEYELRKNSGMLFTMMGSMGLTKDAAYDMSTSLTMLAEDMASLYNISSEDAFTKLRSGITGEQEPLKALGIMVDENTVKSYAYATGIAKMGSELTQQQKVLARYQAIMAQTANAQGAMARELDSPISQMRVARNEAAMLAIELGQELIPEFLRVVGTARNTMTAFKGLSEETQNTAKRIAVVVVEAGAAVAAVRLLGLAVGASVNPWVTLAVAIAAATASLAGFLKAKKEQEEVNASVSITGQKPSKDVAKVRLNERTGFYEKQIEDSGIFGEKINRWQKIEGQELDQLLYQNRRLSKGDSIGTVDTTADAAAEAERKRIQAIIDAASAAANAGGSGKKQTALQQYEAVTQKIIAIAQDQIAVDKMSQEQFADLLRERLAGLNKVSAADGEVLDKKKAQSGLEKQIYETEKQITQETIENASRRVQLGEISVEQYIKILERQRELAKTEKERLDLTVKIVAENAKLLELQMKTIEQRAEKEKQQLAADQENARHRLAMAKIISTQKKSWAEEEYRTALENLDDEYKADTDTVEQTLALYEEFGEKKKDLDAEGTKTYEAAKKEQAAIDTRYQQAKLTLEHEYIEKAAAYQQSIIDVNNDMIADLISGTKSGHDILEDMWRDFVKQIVAQMFSIKSEMNIFTSLLGGVFGLSGKKSSDSGFSFESQYWGTMTGTRSAGGPVQAGKAYLVGERGKPELFMPRENGSIVPDVSALSANNIPTQINAPFSPTIHAAPGTDIQGILAATRKQFHEEFVPTLVNAVRNNTATRNAVKSV